jgi:hypothetical protein
MHAIYHIMVWLQFHKVVQSYDIWPYMLMISPMLHLLWWGRVVCTSQIAILCLEKGSIFFYLPMGDGVKLLLKGCVNLTGFCFYLQQRALTN